MIKDPILLNDVRADWDTVKNTREFAARNAAWAFSSGGGVSLAFMDFANSLILLFGYSALERALIALRDQGEFSCASTQLSRLMVASKSSLQWVDFNLVDSGREQRNKVAHEQAWLPRAETWKYLDAIQEELTAWSIL